LVVSVQNKPPGASPTLTEPYRVMVVDDSAVVRGLISRMLEDDPDISVVASVGNGQLAINTLDKMDIELVILDIEMPVMDGLTALPKLIAKDKDLRVIMASTLTLRNAEISMKALELGACDYVPKPTSSRDMTGGQSNFQRDLVEKVKTFGKIRRGSGGAVAPAARGLSPRSKMQPKRPKPVEIRPGPVTLRDPGIIKPELLAVGSSTGGPQALFAFFKEIHGKIDVPVIVTQHMPATFTTILAEHITRMSGWPAQEASNGMELKKGHVIVAPGDYHMEIVEKGGKKVVALNQKPPVNFCRPAVDPMLMSVSKLYGAKVLVTILTGMGQDGLEGSKVIAAGGGTVIAQDEASSVVWGMPGAVATAGICSLVKPIKELAQYTVKLMTKGVR